jgi:hypothetical protein
VRQVHDRGYAIRDFTPGNVMVTDDGAVHLVDAETFSRPGEWTLQVYTPGFGAPEQVATRAIDETPPLAIDLYGLGAVLTYLVTGSPPDFLPDSPGGISANEYLRRWLREVALGNPAARCLEPLIVALMSLDPGERPDLEKVEAYLLDSPVSISRHGEALASATGPAFDLDRLITDGVDHIIATRVKSPTQLLWEPGDKYRFTDPVNVQHGAAGVLATLARVHARAHIPGLEQELRTVADWILRRTLEEPRFPPGLHFGRSGTAWALMECAATLSDERMRMHAVSVAERIPTVWPNPDVCHGLAGAGLTQLFFWNATGEALFLDRARRIAGVLVERVERSGSQVRWKIPTDFASALAGLSEYGFAHGMAGIGTFLLECAETGGLPEAEALAIEAAENLVELAQLGGVGATWPLGDERPGHMTYWCNGAAGIGGFLLRTWMRSGRPEFLDRARQAADAIWALRFTSGTSQCHGLAGNAEFLLDLAEAGAGDVYRERALDLARCLYLKSFLLDGRRVVPDESGLTACVPWGIGLSGILSLFLRLRHGSSRMWMPRPQVTAQGGAASRRAVA